MHQENSEFDLQVNIRIQRHLPGGGYSSEALTITETVSVSAADFMEACKIIGQFHDLAERVKVK